MCVHRRHRNCSYYHAIEVCQNGLEGLCQYLICPYTFIYLILKIKSSGTSILSSIVLFDFVWLSCRCYFSLTVWYFLFLSGTSGVVRRWPILPAVCSVCQWAAASIYFLTSFQSATIGNMLYFHSFSLFFRLVYCRKERISESKRKESAIDIKIGSERFRIFSFFKSYLLLLFGRDFELFHLHFFSFAPVHVLLNVRFVSSCFGKKTDKKGKKSNEKKTARKGVGSHELNERASKRASISFFFNKCAHLPFSVRFGRVCQSSEW